MKRQFIIILLAAAMVALCVPAVWSQTTQVKGSVKDEQGKPIAGAIVDYFSKETGRKFDLKTDKKGEFLSLGIASGIYKVTLLKDGQTLWFFDNVRVSLGDENILNFDLAKEKAAAQSGVPAQPGQHPVAPKLTEEQKKQIEAVEKENAKIKGLNEKLAQAKQAQDAGNFDQAIAILSEATQIDPTKDLLWARLGDVERAAGSKQTDRTIAANNYAKAAEAYQKALAIKPTGSYHNNLAEALAKLGKNQEAAAEYNTAAQLDPQNAASYYYNMGAVLTNAGKTDEAIQAFDKTIAADPNKAEAYYWKGVNLLGKAKLEGNKMVAPPGTSEAFNKYLELQPNGQFAQPTKEMLASIGASVQTSYGTRSKKK